MGCGPSTPTSPESQAIDREIQKSRERIQREIKLLLLGTGASGKSTIAKQIKVIHLDGYNEAERKLFKEFIHLNILQGIKTLVKACDLLGGTLSSENQKWGDDIKKVTLQVETINMGAERAKQLEGLWNDEAIQNAWNRRSEFQVDDSIAYFMKDLDRISAADYVPTLKDILYVRIKTTGLKEMQFAHQGFTFRVVDVGGQRSERRKWIHCFQDVTAIIFVAALNDYNLCLEEDQTTNRMLEALELFEKVVNNRWFASVNVMLFLNKKDLFMEALEKHPLTNAFPEYSGDPHDFDECSKFITNKFRSSSGGEGRTLYTYLTCATDTSNIEVVWKAVHDTLTNQAIDRAF